MKKKKKKLFSKPTECKHSHTLPLNYHKPLRKKTKFHSQRSKHTHKYMYNKITFLSKFVWRETL